MSGNALYVLRDSLAAVGTLFVLSLLYVSVLDFIHDRKVATSALKKAKLREQEWPDRVRRAKRSRRRRSKLKKRFSYVKYSPTVTLLSEGFKTKFEELESMIDALPVANADVGRARSLAYTKIEEAFMWIGKALRDQQIATDGAVEHQPARGNE